MKSISSLALGDLAVKWPVARRWGGYRDSKIHLLRNGKVMCTASGLPEYHVLMPPPDNGAKVCANCERIRLAGLKKRKP